MLEFCRQPFTAIEITERGDVYTCCPAFINNYKIGNIFENNVDEIWHSDAAIQLRRKILNNDYSLCRLDKCRQYGLRDIREHDYFTEKPLTPIYVTLAYDKECNLQCISCRDCKIRNTQSQLDMYNSRIDSVLVPLLKNAEILALSGSGEALYSRHSRLLIKKIAQANKKLLFNINTNGILFNNQNLKALGIYGRINEAFVSLPALNKELYQKIMVGSDLDTVINNLKCMSEEHYKTIGRITINSVISKLNYKEIPALIQFAKDLDIFITLSPFDDWGTKFPKEYDYAVWNKNNADFKDFVKVLKKTPYYDKTFMPNLFRDIIVQNGIGFIF